MAVPTSPERGLPSSEHWLQTTVHEGNDGPEKAPTFPSGAPVRAVLTRDPWIVETGLTYRF
jgi:hypothetical protein